MTAQAHQALADARKLVRTLGSAPDPRRRADAVVSELKHVEGWTPKARQAIANVEAWLATRPPTDALKPRLHALLTTLA